MTLPDSSAPSSTGDELHALLACKHVTSLEKLKEVTTCGLTAQAVQSAVTSICVPNQGSQLSYWPPAVCQFRGLTSINLSGNAITFIPQAVRELQGLQQLLLAPNQLGSLPPEIGTLTALTELDVGANQISKLPDALCDLTGLQVLNVWGNRLCELPEGFGCLSRLVRLGLKGNQLAALPDSFTRLSNLVELFLTDNKLTTLPAGFGSLRSLVKLQASYNPLQSLPDDLWQLPALELFRLAVGQLNHWPAPLGSLPRLAWCSLGSNPAASSIPSLPDHLPRVRVADLDLGSKLGQGASGEVFNGVYQGQPVAVKIFLPGSSPDGSTCEEIAITCNNTHHNLTRVVAVVVHDEHGEAGPVSTTGSNGNNSNSNGNNNSSANGSGSSSANGSNGRDSSSGYESIKGLVMLLVKGTPMADRPTSQHLLRCKWPAEVSYSSQQVVSICSGLASALAYLHSKGVCHGDVYAHNIMLQGAAHAVLCDFGASFCYDRGSDGGFWEAMEVRGFGLFMQGLLQSTREEEAVGEAAGVQQQQQRLVQLMHACLADAPAARPRFADLQQQLEGLEC